MERKITSELILWKNSTDRLPIVLYGARQVGKTYIVLEFAKNQYQNYVYFNFESNSELQKVFEKDLSPQRILRELSVLSGTNILTSNTLIFFDEIQACERALTSLKYFAEEFPDYHIISAGSLLGVAIKREEFSFPVGKVQLKTLFPFDFEEFLWALNQKEAVGIIRECYKANSTCSLHQLFLDYFKLYLCLGGMPQVINTYLQNKIVEDVVTVQDAILHSYMADMAKYAQPSETVRIISAFNSVPAQLARESKKFQYKQIKTGARSSQFEISIDWLTSSGIVQKCVKVNQGNYPLIAFAEPSHFKLYMGDIGLLRSKLNISFDKILSDSEILDTIKGALAENYVANTLVFNKNVCYYWESEGKAEVDFVIQHNEGGCIPIEVKSSENVKAKSLQQFIMKYKPVYSIRISRKNFGFENGIKSVPLYACFCIGED